MSERTVIVLDDRGSVRRRVAQQVGKGGGRVLPATNAAEAIALLERAPHALLVADHSAGTDRALEWVREIRSAGHHAALLLAEGCNLAALSSALADPQPPPPETPDLARIFVGRSRAVQHIRDYLRQLATTSTNVLITGETGTGKELVAQALHALSARRCHRFVAVNCAAIPDTLLESELFGAERGAYTSSVSTRDGRFILADGGTLFLDEIGELSPLAQAKLLRALETRRIDRLGAQDSRPVDVRVIAATNEDIGRLVERGAFRADLYYRIGVCRVAVPPLRERLEDLALLCAHLLRGLNDSLHTAVAGCAETALAALRRHTWPGNIRELRNVLEASLVSKREGMLESRDLPSWFFPRCTTVEGGAPADRTRLLAALEQAGWNKSRAARTLNCSRMTLYRKMAAYDIATAGKSPARDQSRKTAAG
ncbi:MAG: sigma 54-interacting transcriptional regulator [Bryobacteraceae bacterium]|nr:sigma 54-interacting transcriptional regulator [Bryobacteraceae bacterium]